MKSQTMILLNASVEGTMQVLTVVQVQQLIEKLRLNEYKFPSEKDVKVIKTVDLP